VLSISEIIDLIPNMNQSWNGHAPFVVLTCLESMHGAGPQSHSLIVHSSFLSHHGKGA